jgi:large subunit ribosomal protein L25
MDLLKISATRRTASGKGPAKRLRRDHQVPAIVYGRGPDAQPVVVSPKDLHRILDSERGRNSVVELELEGGQRETVLLNAFQYHPVTRAWLHADFLRVAPDQPVNVDVPFSPVGKAQGMVKGGTLRIVFHKIPVRCLANQIPTRIEHDITELDLEQTVAVSDLTLPEGIEVRLPPTRTVAALVTEKKAAEEPAAPGAQAAAASSASEPAAPAT